MQHQLRIYIIAIQVRVSYLRICQHRRAQTNLLYRWTLENMFKPCVKRLVRFKIPDDSSGVVRDSKWRPRFAQSKCGRRIFEFTFSRYKRRPSINSNHSHMISKRSVRSKTLWSLSLLHPPPNTYTHKKQSSTPNATDLGRIQTLETRHTQTQNEKEWPGSWRGP